MTENSRENGAGQTCVERGPAPDAMQEHPEFLAGPSDRILITGAAGFIGSAVVESLLRLGFRNIACFTRPSSKAARLEQIQDGLAGEPALAILQGNLLSPADCEAACKDVSIIYHLAAGTGEKSYPDAYMNSVVTTRNLLEAARRSTHLKRFVLVSSFAVYTNRQASPELDETCPIEGDPAQGGDAYWFAKMNQEKIVEEYSRDFGIPYTIARPGSVYGPGKSEITGRVGLGTFGIFLHLGGSNRVPFTFVENCADAIALAGLVRGVEGEAFNVVDDDLPSSRQFLRMYKRRIRCFRSIYLPHAVSFGLCWMWERYSKSSQGQLPQVFNRRRWYSEWRNTRYSNLKLKTRLGWSPRVSTADAMRRYCEGSAVVKQHA